MGQIFFINNALAYISHSSNDIIGAFFVALARGSCLENNLSGDCFKWYCIIFISAFNNRNKYLAVVFNVSIDCMFIHATSWPLGRGSSRSNHGIIAVF